MKVNEKMSVVRPQTRKQVQPSRNDQRVVFLDPGAGQNGQTPRLWISLAASDIFQPS